MLRASLLRRAFCVQKTVFESWDEEDDALVFRVRPRLRDRNRCGVCQRKAPFHDSLTEGRRWRSLNFGAIPVLFECSTHRVRCREHGVVVAHVPWARRDSRFTTAFEDQAAWMVTHCNMTAVGKFLGVAWRTIQGICRRVTESAHRPPLKSLNLERIGIDEFSYRKRHRYVTVVVDHDSGKLIWAAKGANKNTLNRFFDELGPEGRSQLKLVTRDGATWISDVISDRCPNAHQCMDPFHVVQWATAALDEERRAIWRTYLKFERPNEGKFIKGTRWVLLKGAEKLSRRDRVKLSEVRLVNDRLYRAYLLKEQLRQVFREPYEKAVALLDDWLAWAQRCRIDPFVRVARAVRERRDEILASIEHGLSNGRVEAINTGLRVLARQAYGFRSAQALIAMGMLKFGGLCPPLPWNGASCTS